MTRSTDPDLFHFAVPEPPDYGIIGAMPPLSTSVHPVAASFAAWMAGSKAAALAAVEAAVQAVPLAADLTSQMAAVFREFRHKPVGRGVDLDTVLRSDLTIVVGLEHPLVRGDVRRLHVLQHEMKRACLTSTLLNVPPGPRAAIILIEILGLPMDQAAEIFGGLGALNAAYSRGQRRLEAYLGPRCEHVDPNNMCHCAARVGGALKIGFMDWPGGDDATCDGPVVAPRRGAEAHKLFATLPPPR